MGRTPGRVGGGSYRDHLSQRAVEAWDGQRVGVVGTSTGFRVRVRVTTRGGPSSLRGSVSAPPHFRIGPVFVLFSFLFLGGGLGGSGVGLRGIDTEASDNVNGRDSPNSLSYLVYQRVRDSADPANLSKPRTGPTSREEVSGLVFGPVSSDDSPDVGGRRSGPEGRPMTLFP